MLMRSFDIWAVHRAFSAMGLHRILSLPPMMNTIIITEKSPD
jgi:hypothetical protein